jgi:hypothetical protein
MIPYTPPSNAPQQHQQQQQQRHVDGNNIRSMNDLLFWGIENSDPNELHHMAQTQEPNFNIEESRAKVKWLHDNLQEMGLDADLTKRMMEIIRLLKDDTTPFETRIARWEELGDIVEDIDLSQDFAKLDGLTLIANTITRKDINQQTVNDVEIMEAAAHVLGTCAQNNPVFQQALLSHETTFIIHLLELMNHVAAAQKISKDSESDELQELHDTRQRLLKKLLFALSSIVSANPAAIDALIQLPNAIQSFNSLLIAATADVRSKIVFLLTRIITVEIERSSGAFVDQLVGNGTLDVILIVLKDSVEANQTDLIEKTLQLVQELKDTKNKAVLEHYTKDKLLEAGVAQLQEKIKQASQDDYLHVIGELLSTML